MFIPSYAISEVIDFLRKNNCKNCSPQTNCIRPCQWRTKQPEVISFCYIFPNASIQFLKVRHSRVIEIKVLREVGGLKVECSEDKIVSFEQDGINLWIPKEIEGDVRLIIEKSFQSQ